MGSADHAHMARALELARRGLYTASPNPRVGCVIVRDGAVVGEGWHERTGEPHAEVHALAQAGARAVGATAYVTLEPCNHHGRTPPCVDSLIAARVARVVAAMKDPNPQVAGGGLERLQAAGIAVGSGVLGHEAYELNIGFVSRMTRGRPWARLKVAASLDGRTALADGASRWITGEPARRDGHRWRARACAVLTGIGTVREDDPQLSVRLVESPRQPLKVVVDRDLAVPLEARVLEGGALVACAREHPDKMRRLAERGAEVLVLPDAQGKVDLMALMRELARRGMNEVHVEAGARLNGALVHEGCIDEVLFYFAPHLLGDGARGMFDLPPLAALAERRELQLVDVRQVGDDLRIVGRLREAVA